MTRCVERSRACASEYTRESISAFRVGAHLPCALCVHPQHIKGRNPISPRAALQSVFLACRAMRVYSSNFTGVLPTPHRSDASRSTSIELRCPERLFPLRARPTDGGGGRCMTSGLKSRSGVGWRPTHCHFGGVRGGSPAKKILGLRLSGTHLLSLC